MTPRAVWPQVAGYVLQLVTRYAFRLLKFGAIAALVFAAPSVLIWIWMTLTGQSAWESVWSNDTLTRPQIADDALRSVFGLGLLLAVLRAAFDLFTFRLEPTTQESTAIKRHASSRWSIPPNVDAWLSKPSALDGPPAEVDEWLREVERTGYPPAR